MGLIFSLGCVKMKLTPEEALNALTINAAYAMGLSASHGTISLGKTTPVILTKKIPSLAYMPYAFGDVHVERLVGGGTLPVIQ
jgi:imidazolonepropionase